MKLLVKILILLALALTAVLVFDSAGYVLIYLPVKQKISLEMTFWTFLGLALATIYIIFLLLKLYKWLDFLFLPKVEKKAFKANKKSNNIVLQALVNFADADFKKSQTKLSKAFNLTSSFSNASLLFFANLQTKNLAQAEEIVQTNFSEYSELTLLGKGLIALKEDFNAQKHKNLLQELAAKSHLNPTFSYLLFNLHKRHSSFVKALTIAPNLFNNEFLTNEELASQVRFCIYQILATATANAKDASFIATSIDAINKNFKSMKADANLIKLYAEFLHKYEKFAELESLINYMLKTNNLGFLVEIYAQLPHISAKNRLNELLKWRKSYGDSYELNLAIAKNYMFSEEFSKAETEFLALYKQKPNSEIAFELANFYAWQNDMEKSISFLHQTKNIK